MMKNGNVFDTWARLNDDQKFQLICRVIGLVLMYVGIVWEFGIPGGMFCLGTFLWKVSE